MFPSRTSYKVQDSDRSVYYQKPIAYELNYIVRVIKLQHLVSYRPDLDI